MHVLDGFRPHRLPVLIAAAMLLVASACNGGVRPTLTGERIAPAPSPTAIEAQAEPTEAPQQAPTEAAQQDTATEPAGDLEVEAPVSTPEPPEPSEPAEIVGIELFTVEVIESFPHDSAAFTQGLELHDGQFIESTGQRGESDLRRVVPATGEVTQIVPTPGDLFAEGATKVGDEVIQLTWKAGRALYWDAATFELKKEVQYEGQGWGLCYDGSRLIQSDGTPVLIFRDPTTFAETGRIAVTLEGQPQLNVNELECLDGFVWANIWRTDLIVRIDPRTGVINGIVNAASLDRPSGEEGTNVLNGIAWDASTESFYVTGKYWPTMYRVNFVPVTNG